MDDLVDRIDGVITSVVDARAMPLSTSCVLNRTDLLAELRAVRELVPVACAEAAGIVAERLGAESLLVSDGRFPDLTARRADAADLTIAMVGEHPRDKPPN